MPLSIKDQETDRLVRALAAKTGETLTEAITTSIRERLERLETRRNGGLAEALLEIGQRCARLPVLDDRSPDEILNYDERGLPG